MKPLSTRIEALRASSLSAPPLSLSKPRIARTLRILAYLCAGAVLLLGTFVFVGWLRHQELAMAALPGHLRMKPNTSFLFIAASLALLFALTRVRALGLWSRFFASIVLLVAALTLAEYLFHVDLHVDQLLLADSSQGPFPGRMVCISAINFTLGGIALLLLTGSSLKRHLAHALAILLVASSVTSIVDFLYGVSTLDGYGNFLALAIHTALGFLTLGTGVVLAGSDSITVRMLAAPGTSGWLARRALPAIVILPILLGWLYLQGPLEMRSVRFGMALFAVTLVVCASLGLWLVTAFLGRSERQRAEIDRIREDAAEAIRMSEQELRLVTDQLPTLISYIDRDGRFLRANQTYERWTGLPHAAIVGHTIAELFGEPYWEATAAERTRALAGETVIFETIYPAPRARMALEPPSQEPGQGADRRVQITYVPDFDPSGQIRGLVCMVLDVEDQRRTEASIRQSEKLAVVGRLASSIAHEINNPLEAVTNLLYLAEQDSPARSAVRSYVQLAQSELARVTHIVVQTLRFHRQSHYATSCKLSDMTEQVLSLYNGRLAQAGIEVQRRFRSTKPFFCRDGEVRQVIANLIGNAAEAMAAQQGNASQPRLLLLRTRAATSPASGRQGVRLTVADTGHGIPDAVRQTLFQPFHTTKGATGSGLGLWVSKEIVDRHGGHISVRSCVDATRHHTVFAIFLADQEEVPST